MFFLFKYSVPSAIERSEIAPDDQPSQMWQSEALTRVWETMSLSHNLLRKFWSTKFLWNMWNFKEISIHKI